MVHFKSSRFFWNFTSLICPTAGFPILSNSACVSVKNKNESSSWLSSIFYLLLLSIFIFLSFSFIGAKYEYIRRRRREKTCDIYKTTLGRLGVRIIVASRRVCGSPPSIACLFNMVMTRYYHFTDSLREGCQKLPTTFNLFFFAEIRLSSSSFNIHACQILFLHSNLPQTIKIPPPFKSKPNPNNALKIHPQEKHWLPIGIIFNQSNSQLDGVQHNCHRRTLIGSTWAQYSPIMLNRCQFNATKFYCGVLNPASEPGQGSIGQ